MSMEKDFRVPLDRQMLAHLLEYHHAHIKAHPPPETESAYRDRRLGSTLSALSTGVVLLGTAAGFIGIRGATQMSWVILGLTVLTFLLLVVAALTMRSTANHADVIDHAARSQWTFGRSMRELDRAMQRRDNELAILRAETELGPLLEDLNRSKLGTRYAITDHGIKEQHQYTLRYREVER